MELEGSVWGTHLFANRTHPARLWQATPDLKSVKDTRTLYTLMLDFKDFLDVGKLTVVLVSAKL